MHNSPPAKSQDMLLQIAILLGGAVLLLAVVLFLTLQAVQLHYGNLRLQTQLRQLRQEPLLKKQVDPQEVPEYLDADALRMLAAKQQLEFLSSKSGENQLEIILQGGYQNFLDYLQAVSAEPLGELSQIELAGSVPELAGRLVFQQGGKNEK